MVCQSPVSCLWFHIGYFGFISARNCIARMELIRARGKEKKSTFLSWIFSRTAADGGMDGGQDHACRGRA
jgi:hypothetical protein